MDGSFDDWLMTTKVQECSRYANRKGGQSRADLSTRKDVIGWMGISAPRPQFGVCQKPLMCYRDLSVDIPLSALVNPVFSVAP
jgi:hypothetical protein